MMLRRLSLFALIVMLLQVCTASAQGYPARPIRMIVQFAAGGGADFVARILATRLSTALGQSVIVDNRPGANGAIANEVVAKAPPDGYTLLLGAAGALTVSPAVTPNQSFDTLRDFAPIMLVASSPFAITIHPSVPARSLAELIALAKSRTDRLSYGSSGAGGSPHLATELFARTVGAKMVHVPYKGLAPAITDLIGGQIDVLFADVGLVIGQINAGKLRALAVTGAKRSSLLPQLPTVAESGLRGYEAGTWYGVLAPSSVPADIIQRLHAAIEKAIAAPEVRERFATQGLEVEREGPDAFRTRLRNELAKWSRLAKSAKIEIN